MIIGVFAVLATMIVVVARPWRVPADIPPVSHVYLVVLAALIQIPVLGFQQLTFGPLLGVVLVCIWTVYNQHLPGIRLLQVGAIANGLAMASHGGAMPLAHPFPSMLGQSELFQLLPGSKNVIGQPGVWLWLADWISIPMPFITLVISPGDILIFAALVYWSWTCRSAALRVHSLVLPLSAPDISLG